MTALHHVYRLPRTRLTREPVSLVEAMALIRAELAVDKSRKFIIGNTGRTK